MSDLVKALEHIKSEVLAIMPNNINTMSAMRQEEVTRFVVKMCDEAIAKEEQMGKEMDVPANVRVTVRKNQWDEGFIDVVVPGDLELDSRRDYAKGYVQALLDDTSDYGDIEYTTGDRQTSVVSGEFI